MKKSIVFANKMWRENVVIVAVLALFIWIMKILWDVSHVFVLERVGNVGRIFGILDRWGEEILKILKNVG